MNALKNWPDLREFEATVHFIRELNSNGLEFDLLVIRADNEKIKSPYVLEYRMEELNKLLTEKGSKVTFRRLNTGRATWVAEGGLDAFNEIFQVDKTKIGKKAFPGMQKMTMNEAVVFLDWKKEGLTDALRGGRSKESAANSAIGRKPEAVGTSEDYGNQAEDKNSPSGTQASYSGGESAELKILHGGEQAEFDQTQEIFALAGEIAAGGGGGRGNVTQKSKGPNAKSIDVYRKGNAAYLRYQKAERINDLRQRIHIALEAHGDSQLDDIYFSKMTRNTCALMHEAAYLGDIRSIQVLLDHGANPNVRNEDESTPLMVAASRGNVEAIEFLMDYGNANPVTKTPLGATARKNAIESPRPYGNHFIIHRLLKAGMEDAVEVLDDRIKSSGS